jgi:hypothetical protein
MQAWARDVEFAYDDGRVYVQDAQRTWREAAAVLRMPRGDGFFLPLRVEGWSAPPPRDLDGWDHVVEFPLPVRSGALALASDGCGEVIVPVDAGDYRARWSGRLDDYRLQLWPGSGELSEFKSWPHPADELADLPALLGEADGRVAAVSEEDDALDLHVHVGEDERTVHCTGVAGWAATGGRFRHAAIRRTHPALLPFTDTIAALSFRGRVAHRGRLVKDLRQVHGEVAGEFVPFDDVFNGAADLGLGYGQLAAGPVTLLEYYALVATAHGLQTQLVPLEAGRDDLRLLELDRTYVIAREFSVQ